MWKPLISFSYFSLRPTTVITHVYGTIQSMEEHKVQAWKRKHNKSNALLCIPRLLHTTHLVVGACFCSVGSRMSMKCCPDSLDMSVALWWQKAFGATGIIIKRRSWVEMNKLRVKPDSVAISTELAVQQECITQSHVQYLKNYFSVPLEGFAQAVFKLNPWTITIFNMFPNARHRYEWLAYSNSIIRKLTFRVWMKIKSIHICMVKVLSCLTVPIANRLFILLLSLHRSMSLSIKYSSSDKCNSYLILQLFCSFYEKQP